MMSNQVEKIEQNLLELAYSSVRRKVSLALVSFITERSKKTVIDASRDDLASEAGTAKETLIRPLADFKTEGLISVNNGTITILEEDRIVVDQYLALLYLS